MPKKKKYSGKINIESIVLFTTNKMEFYVLPSTIYIPLLDHRYIFSAWSKISSFMCSVLYLIVCHLSFFLWSFYCLSFWFPIWYLQTFEKVNASPSIIVTIFSNFSIFVSSIFNQTVQAIQPQISLIWLPWIWLAL